MNKKETSINNIKQPNTIKNNKETQKRNSPNNELQQPKPKLRPAPRTQKEKPRETRHLRPREGGTNTDESGKEVARGRWDTLAGAKTNAPLSFSSQRASEKGPAISNTPLYPPLARSSLPPLLACRKGLMTFRGGGGGGNTVVIGIWAVGMLGMHK